MKNLKFVQVEKANQEHYELFLCLMMPYLAEIDSHWPDNPPTGDAITAQYTRGMMNMQGPFDRHLELCFAEDALIGFHYYKVDHEGHRGFIKPGYGYIMEFYVKPKYRRQGYGTAMFYHLESVFGGHGTKRMYLTSDPITGTPFWEKLGFADTGEISPENKQKIFEKDVATEIAGSGEKNTISSCSCMARYMGLPVIRPMERYDVSFLHRLLNAPEIRRSIHIGKTDLEEWNSAFDDWQRGRDERSFIVSLDNEPVGWLKLNNLESKDVGWICELVISPTYQRQGVGSDVIRYAADYFKQRGFTKIRLHTDEENQPARACYAKSGFTVTERVDGMGPDGVHRVIYTLEKPL